MTDEVVNIIFELGPAHLELFDFLVGGEIDFLLDPIDRVVQSVVFVEHLPEVIIRPLEPSDDLAMFRKLSQDRMMKIHSLACLTCKPGCLFALQSFTPCGVELS